MKHTGTVRLFLKQQLQIWASFAHRVYCFFSAYCAPLLVRTALLIVLAIQICFVVVATGAYLITTIVYLVLLQAILITLFCADLCWRWVSTKAGIATVYQKRQKIPVADQNAFSPPPAAKSAQIAACAATFLVFALYFVQLFGETTFYTSTLTNLFYPEHVHEVVPGKVYRSSEMSSSALSQVVQEKGIRTVIDLRWGNEAATEEAAAANASGATYYHRPLMGSRANQRSEIQHLITLFDEAETPVLIHCSSGAHRSGVAAAIWMLTKENSSIREAEQQLSPGYGYLHWERRLKSMIQGHSTIDGIIWEYKKTQKSLDISFRDWISLVRESVLAR